MKKQVKIDESRAANQRRTERLMKRWDRQRQQYLKAVGRDAARIAKAVRREAVTLAKEKYPWPRYSAPTWWRTADDIATAVIARLDGATASRSSARTRPGVGTIEKDAVKPI